MGILLLLLFVTACAQTEEGQGVENRENIGIENRDGDQSKNNGEDENTTVTGDQVDSFMHIHGLSYDKKEPANLYMSTHHGLIQIKSSNQWNWIGEPENRHDLMGFTVQNEDTMISSGHPAEGSKLENPLGVVISQDRGATWESIALYGKVDFHIFEVNEGDSSVLYGINSHGANVGFYQSLDGGYTWEKQERNGLPNDFSAIYTLISDPRNPQFILAGTGNGILQSEDGGRTWTTKNTEQSFVSAKSVPQQPGKIIAFVVGKDEGLVISDDFGETWTSLELTIEGDDAVSQIAVHPTQEGVYTVATFKENVLQTTDGGQTWTILAESGKPLN